MDCLKISSEENYETVPTHLLGSKTSLPAFIPFDLLYIVKNRDWF